MGIHIGIIRISDLDENDGRYKREQGTNEQDHPAQAIPYARRHLSLPPCRNLLHAVITEIRGSVSPHKRELLLIVYIAEGCSTPVESPVVITSLRVSGKE